MLVNLIDAARDKFTSSLRTLLSGDKTGVASDQYPGDPGLCGPGSTSWEILADPSAMVGGIRSLLLQSCHPSAIQGVEDHSGFEADPLGRLHRTVAYVTVSTFGAIPEATLMAERVKKAHVNVQGVLPDGTSYDANDPHLLLWVHVALVDSLLQTYKAYGRRPLSSTECDAFVDEQSRVLALLGVSESPRTQDDLNQCLREFRKELATTPAARRGLAFIKDPPLPRAYTPFYTALFNGAVETLYTEHRELLEIAPVSPLARAARVGTATAITASFRGLLHKPESLTIAQKRVSRPVR